VVVSHHPQRAFSTPPLQQVDRSVRTAIQKMMDDYSELSSSSSSSSVDSVKGAAEPSWDLPKALLSLQVGGSGGMLVLLVDSMWTIQWLLHISFCSLSHLYIYALSLIYIYNCTLSLFQNQLHEAESCVQDCRDCASNNNSPAALDTELATADGAIDLAVQRLLDVLDAVRYSSSQSAQDAPVPSFDGTTTPADWAPRIKQLRAQVNLLKHERQRKATTTETVG